MDLKEAVEPIGRLGKSWILFILIYTIARDIAGWAVLSDDGLNPWLLLLIDVGTAYPYGYASAMAAKNFVNRNKVSLAKRHFVKWAVIWLASFVAPWAYVVISVNLTGLPFAVKFGLALLFVVAVFGLVNGFRQEVVKTRNKACSSTQQKGI